MEELKRSRPIFSITVHFLSSHLDTKMVLVVKSDTKIAPLMAKIRPFLLRADSSLSVDR